MTSRGWDEAIALMTARIDETAASTDPGFPHYADGATGEWTRSPAGDWTGGFWVGQLWLAFHRTGDEKYRTRALDFAEQLRVRAESDTVFRGFLFYYGAVLGAKLAGDLAAAEIAVLGARGLAAMVDPVAGVLPLGTTAEEASDTGSTEANIDGVQGGSLLCWAADHLGEPEFAAIAASNARGMARLCEREDGSIVQSATFDPATGQMVRRYTHKGFSDDSTWARAQAWGLIGFTMIADRVDDGADLRAAAARAAEWWIAHVPADGIPYWDFDAPQREGTKLDTSAAAIAAAALLKLAATIEDESLAERYRAHAELTVRSLIDDHLTPLTGRDSSVPGRLIDSCYNHRIDLATESELIWGDYYLYEALHVLAGRLDPLEV